MKTKDKIKWRLGQLPTTEELQKLVKDELLTKEEARQILFTVEGEEELDKKDLQGEVKFLRELVDKLAKNKDVVIREIQRYHDGYWKYDWYRPYYYLTTATTGTMQNAVYVNGTTTNLTTSANSVSLASLN